MPDPVAMIDARPAPAHAVDGNRLILVPDGARGREAVLALIAGAKTDLRLLYYIFADDGAGTEVRDALIAALRRGVRVRLVIDGFGSSDTPDSFFAPLVAGGGEFCRFNPNWGRRYLLRNHQKMTIADGRAAVIGGFNVEDCYFDPARPDGWRDLGLTIEGDAVQHLTRYFDTLKDWIGRKGGTLFGLQRMLKALTQKEGRLRWIFGGPGPVSPYARQLSADLRRARSLRMIMAYFAPNRRMLRQLRTVAMRGDATVITAGKTDVPLSLLAARATYRHLLRRGVQLAEYQPKRLHAKLILLDEMVYVGSANFDIRSLYINLELMLRIEDAGLAAEAQALFERDLAHSRPIESDAFAREATWWNRLRWGAAYFLFTTVDLLLVRRFAR